MPLQTGLRFRSRGYGQPPYQEARGTTNSKRLTAAHSWNSERALSHGVKTTRSCSVPQTARACTTTAPRTTRPVALTLRRGRRHLWKVRRATLHLLRNDRVKKGVPRRSISYPFSLPFLSLATGTKKGDTPKGILLHEGSGPRALLLIRGSKAGPPERFDSRLRALGLRAHYWSEVRRLAPRKGSTAASGHSGSAPTTDQGFAGWPLEGFDSRPRAHRVRDDSGYNRYITKARATLPRYPGTFPRPTGAIL
jgi:hypothetical protein